MLEEGDKQSLVTRYCSGFYHFHWPTNHKRFSRCIVAFLFETTLKSEYPGLWQKLKPFAFANCILHPHPQIIGPQFHVPFPQAVLVPFLVQLRCTELGDTSRQPKSIPEHIFTGVQRLR